MSINKSEKNIIIVYIAIIIIIFILAGTIFSYKNLEESITNRELKVISNDVYEIKYTSYWKNVFGDEKGFELKRNDNAFKLVVTKLQENELEKDILEFSNEAMYEISNFNDYKLMIDESTEIGNKKYICREKLLENEKESIMLYTIKDYKNLYSFSFKSNSRDFDKALVEVESDLSNFSIQNENFAVYSKEYIAFKEISYSEDEKLDEMLIQNAPVIFNNNGYQVTFSLPSNFLEDKDKEGYVASFKGLNATEQGSISIDIKVVNENSIEYLTSNDDFKKAKELLKSETHTNFTDSYGKLNENEYIYKASFYYNPWKESKSLSSNLVSEEGSEMKYETCYIVYEINNEKSVVVRIDSKISGITKKLIKSLKLIEAKKVE